MWTGILALLLYYIGYFIVYFFEGSQPGMKFLGKGIGFYDNLAIFLILPISLLFSVWAILKGALSLDKGKGIAPKVNLTCGVVTVSLFFLSIFLFFIDVLSFGAIRIFFGITYPIFLVILVVVLMYLFRRFKKQLNQ